MQLLCLSSKDAGDVKDTVWKCRVLGWIAGFLSLWWIILDFYVGGAISCVCW